MLLDLLGQLTNATLVFKSGLGLDHDRADFVDVLLGNAFMETDEMFRVRDLAVAFLAEVDGSSCRTALI